MAAQRAGQQGFTFFELMIVLVILGIALAMGVPRLQDSVLRSRVVSDAGDFMSTLIYARNQAITSGYNVVVCASSDKATCTGSWKQGWIVYRDIDSSGTLNSGDKVIRKHGGLDKVTVTPSTATSSVGFTSRGYSVANVANDFLFCGPGTDGTWHGRKILLENTGRAMRDPTNASGACP